MMKLVIDFVMTGLGLVLLGMAAVEGVWLNDYPKATWHLVLALGALYARELRRERA